MGRRRQVGLEFLGSGVVTIKPGNWKEILKSEIIRHVGKLRFRGYTHDKCRRAIEINDVMEVIMDRDDLKYHSIDMVAQHRVGLRLIVDQLERLVEVDLSYSYFLVEKSWKFFFNEIISNQKVKLRCLKFEGDKITSIDSDLIADALCQIEEVHVQNHMCYLERKVSSLMEKIAKKPKKEIKLKKLVISPRLAFVPTPGMIVQQDMNENLLAKAILKLETLCLVGSKLSPLQENTIYRQIIQSDVLVMKSLDVRRTSTALNDVDGDLQADAVVRLHEYKATVNEEQAKKILDQLLKIHDPQTKHLLLIVRKRNGLPGELKYCAEKMSGIRAKLCRFKVINGV